MKKITIFSSALKDADISVGDVIELRDFSPYLPKVPTANSIPWKTVNYRLLDSTPGKMLSVEERMPYTEDTPYDEIDFSVSGMPDVIEIPIPFSGTYRISAGFPVFGEPCGIDLALNEEGFAAVFPEYGGRYGRMIGLEQGRECYVFWQNAVLDRAVIRIRIPWGTYSAADLNVCAALSSLRFERLKDSASLAPVSGDADKTFIMVEDGFSAYALYGIPGEPFDVRLNRVYKDSDVRIYMSQVMGPMLWKTDVNTYLGEGVTPDQFAGKRVCDARAIKYIRDSVEQQYEVFRVQTKACHDIGAEMHFSIRANLYFQPTTTFMSNNDYMNGRFWHEHPEYRLPDSSHLDYGIREVRDYYLSVYRDALQRFDLDGINLDLTRWPRCLDARYHSPELLIGFCRELRALADSFGEKRGRHIQVSLLMVEYYHSYSTLADQAIDFEGLCASGVLDFICLETNEMERYAPIAHRYGVKVHGIVDGASPYYNNVQNDPLWELPDGSVTDDPRAGEEFEKPKWVGTKPAPFEQVRLMDSYYETGADGIAKINAFMGSLYFRDCGHSDAVHRHAEEGSVFGQTAGNYIFVTDR